MKKEKLLIVTLLVVLFVVAWVVTISAVTGAEKKKEQERLVEEATNCFDKELYVRAIPLYEDALKIKTEKNTEIETMLLNAYYAHGDVWKYTDLVKSRQKRKVATEDEIVSATNMLMDRSKTEEAMGILNAGLVEYDSQKLIDCYEKNAYRYRSTDTDYQIIKSSANKSQFAAFNGEKWEYVDTDYGWSMNRSETEGKYDFATSFTVDGYAVVGSGGKYYVIVESGDHYGVAQESFEDIYDVSGKHVIAKQNGKYGYYNLDFESASASHRYDQITDNACGVAAVNKDGKWGIITDGGETVVDFNLQDVAINSLNRAFSNNVAMVNRDGRWHLINTKGEDVIDQTYANAKAPESDQYIAVANDQGEWGFIDHQGNLVIDYQFQDARSFSDGMAAVLSGVYWKYITLRGNVAIEENFIDAEPFHNGKAIAYNDENAVLLKLEYVKASKY